MALSPDTWSAIRAEWEVGALSGRQLGEKYGVTEAAIRKWATNPKQPGGVWVKDAGARQAIAERAARLMSTAMGGGGAGSAPVAAPVGAKPARSRGAQQVRSGARSEVRTKANSDNCLRGQAPKNEGKSSRKVRTPDGPAPRVTKDRDPERANQGANPGGANPPSDPMAAHRERAMEAEAVRMAPLVNPDARMALRERVIDLTAHTIAAANIEHLNRLTTAGSIADRLGRLLDDYLAGGEEVGIRANQAMNRLMAGRGDSLGAHLQAYMKVLGELQAQTRKALGADDKAKLDVTVTNGQGPPVIDGQAMDISALPTEQLVALLGLADMITAQQGEAPLPMPPGDPQAGEGT